MIGVVASAEAIMRVADSPRLSSFINSAAHGRLHIAVPALALAYTAAHAGPDVAAHVLRLTTEVPRQRMFVAPINENALFIGEEWLQGGRSDYLLAQTCYEAAQLVWPVLTVDEGPASGAARYPGKIATITLD